MKEENWSKFKLKKASEIKTCQCIKVISDGELLFYAVIKPEGEMKNRIEGMCSLIDASRGF